MKQIKLSVEKWTWVDNDDFEHLECFKWSILGKGYAGRDITIDKKRKHLWLHRIIWELHNVPIPHGFEIDHIDGNKLNNQLINLRLVTRSQNNANRKKRGGCSCKYKGVSWDKERERWEACINIDGKRIHLGRFSSQFKAAHAYDDKAVEVYGEHARTNFTKKRA